MLACASRVGNENTLRPVRLVPRSGRNRGKTGRFFRRRATISTSTVSLGGRHAERSSVSSSIAGTDGQPQQSLVTRRADERVINEPVRCGVVASGSGGAVKAGGGGSISSWGDNRAAVTNSDDGLCADTGGSRNRDRAARFDPEPLSCGRDGGPTSG
jgi:hypothetical protein